MVGQVLGRISPWGSDDDAVEQQQFQGEISLNDKVKGLSLSLSLPLVLSISLSLYISMFLSISLPG